MKNISSGEDALSNLFMPFVHMGDVSSILKNRKLASKLKDNRSVTINGTKINRLQSGKERGFLQFRYKGKELRFYYDSGKRMMETLGMIRDEFINQESARIEVKKRDVVDIGAYVADTSILFALNGARHVYALEPYPYFYGLGMKNIEANRLSKKITLLNAACGSENSTVEISDKETNFSRVQSTKRKGKGIGIMSLENVIKKYNLKGASLKVDCEGCEYDIILKTDSNMLRRFDNIQIEYHYGYSNLVKRLREVGFKVSFTKPVKKYNFVTRSFMVIGFINASLR